MSDPGDGLRQDMLRFSEQLAEGARRLAGLEAEPSHGATPRETVCTRDGTRLYRYASPAPRAVAAPLLVVYALVNRPYMLDLEPDRSFIRGLLDTGRDVHLLDWGAPDEQDTQLGLDDYLTGHLHACVELLCNRHAVDRVDLLGVCQGGTFSLCYAALEPARVRRLALMVTPVDFHAPGFLLTHWMRYVDVDRLVDTFGNVPGSLLNRAFLALKPLSLSHGKGRDLLALMRNPRELASFARMEQWLHDSPDQAGRAFREFAAAFIRDNALVKGGLEVAGRPIDLAALCCPILNLYATGDHIVPPASSRALAGLVDPARYSEVAHDGGHIGVFASRRAQAIVPARVGSWLTDGDPG